MDVDSLKTGLMSEGDFQDKLESIRKNFAGYPDDADRIIKEWRKTREAALWEIRTREGLIDALYALSQCIAEKRGEV